MDICYVSAHTLCKLLSFLPLFIAYKVAKLPHEIYASIRVPNNSDTLMLNNQNGYCWLLFIIKLNNIETLKLKILEWSRCGVMAKVLYVGLELSEFKLQSRYYTHFRTNTLGKGMNRLIPPFMGWIVSLLFFYKDDFGI